LRGIALTTVGGFLHPTPAISLTPSLSHSLSVKQFKIIIAIVIVLVGEEPNKKEVDGKAIFLA